MQPADYKRLIFTLVRSGALHSRPRGLKTLVNFSFNHLSSGLLLLDTIFFEQNLFLILFLCNFAEN
jgi:hypothetical protein